MHILIGEIEHKKYQLNIKLKIKTPKALFEKEIVPFSSKKVANKCKKFFTQPAG